MKRKAAAPEPVVDKELLENAKRSVQTDRAAVAQKCSVCGSPCAPNCPEDLCWVCRRLKISAWKDADQQMAQE